MDRRRPKEVGSPKVATMEDNTTETIDPTEQVSVAELRQEVIDLKKRVEDLEAKTK